MKLFIVDFLNCLELSHFETFFYKNIKDGNISVYPESLSSYAQFELIYKWLLEEINRNPFSITEGLVLFYIPRNLTQKLDYYDIDNTAKIYIRELISSKLDSRFSFACVFVDQTGKDTNQDKAYQTIKKVCKGFYSEETAIRRGVLSKPRSSIHKVSELLDLISDVQDNTIQDFFTNILENELDSSNQTNKQSDEVIVEAFFQNCSQAILPIKSMNVAYFGSDISKKTETLLKLISYVCDFAEQPNNKEFDKAVDEFLNTSRYEKYDPDYDNIRKRIVTYKNRLSSWLETTKNTTSKAEEPVHPLSYHETDDSQSFKHKIESIITEDYAEKILNPFLEELDEFDASERVFSVLDKTIENVDKELHAFCDGVVDNIYDFRNDNGSFLTEEASGAVYTSEEAEELSKALDSVNQYAINELPGYSAELKLRQELDNINTQIQYFGKRIKAASPKAFIITLCFAIMTVLVLYFFAQRSVFTKESTWWVFGIYIAICSLSFVISFFLLKLYYKRRVRKLLKECQKKINEFLESYKKRAEEFETNINHSMSCSCVQDKHFKIADQRHTATWTDERFQWHKLKTMSILKNLKHFDGFLAEKPTEPEKETNGPKSPSADAEYLHDAAHSEFYQMRIFGS